MRKSWDNPVAHALPTAGAAPTSVQIGAVRIAPATVLAPMAGVTDTVFRRFIRNVNLHHGADPLVTAQQSGCGLIITEFTSADGVLRARDHKNQRMLDRYLHFYLDEHPINPLLFRSDPP